MLASYYTNVELRYSEGVLHPLFRNVVTEFYSPQVKDIASRFAVHEYLRRSDVRLMHHEGNNIMLWRPNCDKS